MFNKESVMRLKPAGKGFESTLVNLDKNTFIYRFDGLLAMMKIKAYWKESFFDLLIDFGDDYEFYGRHSSITEATFVAETIVDDWYNLRDGAYWKSQVGVV